MALVPGMIDTFSAVVMALYAMSNAVVTTCAAAPGKPYKPLSHLQNSATQTPEFPTEDAPRSGTEVI
jgi:hypothetical protein